MYIITYVVAIASIPLMPKSFSGLLVGQLIQNLSSARGVDIFLHVCTMLLAAVKFVVSAEVEAFSSLLCC